MQQWSGRVADWAAMHIDGTEICVRQGYLCVERGDAWVCAGILLVAPRDPKSHWLGDSSNWQMLSEQKEVNTWEGTQDLTHPNGSSQRRKEGGGEDSISSPKRRYAVWTRGMS